MNPTKGSLLNEARLDTDSYPEQPDKQSVTIAVHVPKYIERKSLPGDSRNHA